MLLADGGGGSPPDPNPGDETEGRSVLSTLWGGITGAAGAVAGTVKDVGVGAFHEAVGLVVSTAHAAQTGLSCLTLNVMACGRGMVEQAKGLYEVARHPSVLYQPCLDAIHRGHSGECVGRVGVDIAAIIIAKRLMASEAGAVEAGEAEAGAALNSLGRAYPKVLDIRTGEPIPYPGEGLTKIPVEARVPWGASERAAFIKEWYNRGFSTPEGGWSNYDIHHILPREYGGTNSFDNLVPVERSVHQNEFNPWWRGY
jgi:hypothetical protein